MDKPEAMNRELHIPVDTAALMVRAQQCAHTLPWVAGKVGLTYFSQQVDALHKQIHSALTQVTKEHQDQPQLSERSRWLYDNAHLLRSTLTELKGAASSIKRMSLPHVFRDNKPAIPRAVAIAEDMFEGTSFQYGDALYIAYLQAFQSVAPLRMDELNAMPLALKLALLEKIAANLSLVSSQDSEQKQIGLWITALRNVSHAPFKDLTEPLMLCHSTLLQDPAGVYPRMNFESRDIYRQAIAKLSRHSDHSEIETAKIAIELALLSQQEIQNDPRVALRKAHVGYYLVAEGASVLMQRIQVHLPIAMRLQNFLRRHPDEFYLGGIEVVTGLLIMGILVPMIQHFDTFIAGFFTLLILLFPCSQAAVEVVNFLITSFLPPAKLSKLDFSESIPDDCTTMVVVPTLLLSEAQVRRLVSDLEIRYIGNRSRNLYFALLTDLPDSEIRPREDNELIDLCDQLIRTLNAKYRQDAAIPFALFHRHRIFNPREGVWMGWERKRGKLLDFNKLILGEHDSFPHKIADLSVLKKVRYVLTLDSDTELPRGAAHRLIGTIAHPLNQAIVDPVRNIVTRGYGILQPRVGISVMSASRSRLASIYSGETGFDIYTRATSDVYQDLYGEGIFTGKGIYEVQTLHAVLDRRFPRNSLLSHDLIEGAYARAGLVSDIEVVDDYPSHYSAYNRRKHRWMRGDWQIIEWLSPRVRDEAGRIVPNPIRLISGWKILDNLRRSLVEPATFVFLLLGWLVLPGSPLYWTLSIFVVLFVSLLFQFFISFIKGLISDKPGAVRESFLSAGASFVSVILMLTFLAHQAMLAMDAILRSSYRRKMSRQRLLEWESAAQAEMGMRSRTLFDIVLDWMPVVAAAIGALVVVLHHRALTIAIPVLFLWACSKPLSLWLNLPPRSSQKESSSRETAFLRSIALHTWRYFSEFSNADENWLIPDNVQLEPHRIASRISPTNLGFLLNARQAACELGYLTLPEFVELTSTTLKTALQLERHKGHFLNWYDTRTLQPLKPYFISTVDSGNLAASLLSLKQGCMAQLKKPLIHSSLYDGYVDNLLALVKYEVLSKRDISFHLESQQARWKDITPSALVLELSNSLIEDKNPDALWFYKESVERAKQLSNLIHHYEPWRTAEFQPMRDWFINTNIVAQDDVALEDLPGYLDTLIAAIETAQIVLTPGRSLPDTIIHDIHLQLSNARKNTEHLITNLKTTIDSVQTFLDEMDFSFLLDSRRKLLSIGYSVEKDTLDESCYDLLGSESRIASFLAVSRGDASQETWVLLGREHVLSGGRPVLISWTGTMFEYLMPFLWMHSHQNTLLQRAMYGAVKTQQRYAAHQRVPWGISESAYSQTDDERNYQYHAFGVPELALRGDELARLVIAPYASILALEIDPHSVLNNLTRMDKFGWFSSYGFYEAVDYFDISAKKHHREFKIVKSWMAHHQGMSLLSITNFLCNNVMQQYFHQNPQVQASELLLHERPVHFAATKEK
ncbi:MAG: glucoamylase family protein [Acidobacteriaceae bacterium]